MRRSILALLLLVARPAGAAEDIGSVGYRFKWLGPNDKIVVEAFDDPDVPGVTCYMSHARTGGIKGAIGLAEDPARPRSPAARSARSTRPSSTSSEKPARGIQRTGLADLQDDPGHALLGRQAPGPGLPRLYRPHHRRQPAQFDQRRAGWAPISPRKRRLVGNIHPEGMRIWQFFPLCLHPFGWYPGKITPAPGRGMFPAAPSARRFRPRADQRRGVVPERQAIGGDRTGAARPTRSR